MNDELQRRINEYVLNGDAPSIIWAMEGQIRINTKLEAKLTELERREALLTAVLDEAVEYLERTAWPPYGNLNARGPLVSAVYAAGGEPDPERHQPVGTEEPQP